LAVDRIQSRLRRCRPLRNRAGHSATDGKAVHPGAEKESSVNTHKQWRIEILLNENDHETQALARLDTHDDHHAHGQGTARRSPIDTDRPQICDQLAVARALSELANKLAGRAGRGLEGNLVERVSRPVNSGRA